MIGIICLTILGCSRQPTYLESSNPTVTLIEPEVTLTVKTTSPPVIMNETLNGNANVNYVIAEKASNGTWTFIVTISHPDKGWEDYADGWDVITHTGEVIKVNAEDRFTRVLLHPHVNEQPFTRSQSNIIIPEEITQVIVRAHDLVDGFGGNEILVDLLQTSGDLYEIRKSD